MLPVSDGKVRVMQGYAMPRAWAAAAAFLSAAATWLGCNEDAGGPGDADAAGGDDGDAGWRESPGVKRVAQGIGPFADFDPEGDGFVAVGGSPAKMLQCALDGAGMQSCKGRADIPFAAPVNYLHLANGHDAVVGLPPTLLIFGPIPQPLDGGVDGGADGGVDGGADGGVDGGAAMYGNAAAFPFGKVVFPGLDASFNVASSSGLFAHHAAAPARDRVCATAKVLDSGGASIQGAILCFGAEGRPYGPLEGLPWFTGGIDPTALALVRGGDGKEMALGLNSGVTDRMDGDGTSFFTCNPNATEMCVKDRKVYPLGKLRASPVAELALDESAGLAYATIEEPAKKVVAFNYLKGEIARWIELGDAVAGGVNGIVFEGASKRLYIADGNGNRIAFVDLDAGKVAGTVPLPGSPTAMALVSGFLFVSAGDDMIRIEPQVAVPK